MPVKPPMANSIRNEIAYSIGASRLILPVIHGRQPVEDFDAGRNRDQEGQGREDHGGQLRLAGDEHVVAPDDEAEQRDARRWSKRWRGIRRSSCGEKVGMISLDDRHARQNHDVDGRMRVEPEEVLEQHRIAADARIEDADLEDAFDASAAPG